MSNGIDNQKYAKLQTRLVRMLIFIIMLFLSFTFLLPFIYILINSFKGNVDYFMNRFALPRLPLRVENYAVMYSQFRIFKYIRNTVIIIFITQLLVVFPALCASYTFAKIKFAGKKFLYMLVIAALTIPAQVTMIPQYIMFGRLGLMGGYWPVILAYLGNYLVSNIVLMTSFFKGTPNELLESAKIDGCGYIKSLLHVVLPVGMPVVIINLLLNTIYMWNDLLIPMIFLTDDRVRTVMVALASLQDRLFREPTFQYAGLVISALPMIIVFAIFRDKIVNGVLMGSVK